MLHTCTLPGPDAILQIMMLFVPPLLGHHGDQLLFIMATSMILSVWSKSRLYEMDTAGHFSESKFSSGIFAFLTTLQEIGQ